MIPTQQSIKAMHLKEIYLKALHHNGISRAQLKREMHLSFPSISALVEELLTQGILYETGIQESTQRGRPQTILCVHPDALAIPVATMTADGYLCALYDSCANKKDEQFLPFRTDCCKCTDAGGQWHPDTTTLLEPLKNWMDSLSQYKLSDFVLCISGNFDEQGVMTSSAIKITTPENFLNYLKEALGNDTVILNNADCYAYAEKFHQTLPEDFIFIQVSEGVGAGIIRDGKIFQKDVIRAGEIGHMSIDYHGKSCVCGGKGCLERYISTLEITEEVRALLQIKETISFSQVCDAYHNADPRVVQLISHKAELLAVGISNMLAMQPVQHIILGGDITMLGESFLEEVQLVMKKRGLRRYLDRVTVTYSRNTGNELPGALWNYLEHLLKIDSLIGK